VQLTNWKWNPRNSRQCAGITRHYRITNDFSGTWIWKDDFSWWHYPLSTADTFFTRMEIFLIKKSSFLLRARSRFYLFPSTFCKIQSSHFRVMLKTHFHVSWNILFHFLLDNYNRLLYIIDLWFDMFLFIFFYL